MTSLFGLKTGLVLPILCVFCTQPDGVPRSKGQSAVQSRPAPRVAGHLKILGFTLGKSTLADVQAKLGKSSARRCSPKEEASKELCYQVDNGQTTLVFEAGFSGGWKVLDGYKVIAGSSRLSCYRQCPKASQVTNDVETEGGLKLGLTREELLALIGHPEEIRGNKLTFEWQSRQAMTNDQKEAASKTFDSSITDPYFDVQDTIEVTLMDSKVIEFAVNHVVSY